MNSRQGSKGRSPDVKVVKLTVNDIIPDPGQPRKTFEADGIDILAESLRETGQISPVIVKPLADGRFMIVVGERRWRAAKISGLSEIECIIRHDIDEQMAYEMQLAENYHREAIPPLEQAKSLKQYLDQHNLSQRELSRRTGIPQRTISDRLALLSLPVSVHAHIEAGMIGPYEALKIAALPPEQQEAAAEALLSARNGTTALEKPSDITGSVRPVDTKGRKVLQDRGILKIADSLSERIGNLEGAIYELARAYGYNQIAMRVKDSDRLPPPCPECLKAGNEGYLAVFRRRMTNKDLWELIKALEENDSSGVDMAELLKIAPTHVQEVKCNECVYKEFIGYYWE